MVYRNDILTEEVEMEPADMPQNDFETVSCIIHQILCEKGIICDSFSWSVNIKYLPQENNDE